MLVLSRKAGERIHIGNDIMVEVRRIAGNRVTLALRAPRDVRILRGELEKPAREFDPDVIEPAAETAIDGADQSVEPLVVSLPALSSISCDCPSEINV